MPWNVSAPVIVGGGGATVVGGVVVSVLLLLLESAGAVVTGVGSGVAAGGVDVAENAVNMIPSGRVFVMRSTIRCHATSVASSVLMLPSSVFSWFWRSS